jgi:chaperonin GroES
MTVKIKPLSNRVVVKLHATEEKTQGGIYIPTKSDEKVLAGEVVAIGPGKQSDGKHEAMTLSVGQHIMFNQYSATEVESEGEKYSILREDDVMAIIE